MNKDDAYWMRLAIDLAKEGKTKFGALIVDDAGQYVGGFNTTIQDGPVAHAEINAIKKMKELDYDQAQDLTLYTTVEPCPMCMSAIIWAGIGRLVYGASISFVQQFGKQITLSSKQVAAEAWYAIEINPGIERKACEQLFSSATNS